MKMDRLISIIMLLLERSMISAAELAKTFEVSTRTIYRDVETIAQAGIPIVAYPGQNGGIAILEQYKVDKRLFTAADITSLLIGLDGVHSAFSGEEIAHTLAKIRSLIPEEQRKAIERQIKQTAIDLTPWMKDSSLDAAIGLIRTALTHNRTLTFAYTTASGRTTSREVEPYRLLHRGDSWYLQGYCLLRREFRTFRLLRMEHLATTENEFVPREFDPSTMEMSGMPNDPMVEVVIRFDDTVKRSITDFYGQGVLVTSENGMHTAKIVVMDNEQGYNLLFLYGERCECLAPARVRDYIAQKAAIIAAMHRSGLQPDK